MSLKLPRITGEQLIGAVERDAWFFVRQHSSHHIYAHPTKPGTLSIPVHQGRILGVGYLHKKLTPA